MPMLVVLGAIAFPGSNTWYSSIQGLGAPGFKPAALPSSLIAYAGVAIQPGLVLIHGGLQSASYTSIQNNTYVYNHGNNTWTNKANGPIARGFLAGGVLSSDIAAFVGGILHDNSVTTANTVYSYSTNTFASKAAIPSSVRYMKATQLTSNQISIIGGEYPNNNQIADQHSVYDYGSDTWITKAFRPSAAAYPIVLNDGSRVVAIGGEDSGPTFLTAHHAYDRTTDTWSTRAAYPFGVSRAGGALIVANKYLVVAGLSINSNYRKEAYLYDMGSDSWARMEDLPTERYWHEAISPASGVVVVPGGFTSAAVTNENDVYYL